MTWTNAFDLGECTVSLNFFGGESSVFWSGVLGKGESSPSIDILLDVTGVVSVDADGVVSFATSAPVGGSGWSAKVDVVPSYGHDYPARVRQLAYATDIREVDAYINTDSPGVAGADYVAYYEGGAAEGDHDLPPPDPIDMSAFTGRRDMIGVYYAAVGA